MAITFDGTGGLFTRLGKLFGTWRDCVSSLNTLNTNLDDAADAYDGDLRFSLGALLAARGTLLESLSTTFDAIKVAAESTLIEQLNADNPLPGKTVEAALKELIVQMVAGSETVLESTASVAATAGSGNTGTGVCAVSVAYTTALDYEAIYAEDLILRCVVDGQADADYDGLESWTVIGEANVEESDRLWSADGSGVSTTTTTICGSTDAGSGPAVNRTTNGDFESFTVANTPDNWQIAVGTAGVTVFSSVTAARGSTALRMLGDGATLTAVRQEFANSSYTSARLRPNTWHTLSFWSRHNGVVPTAGVCRVSLQDGSSSVLWSSSVSFNASALTGSWVNSKVNFRTGADVPAVVRLVIEQTTAMDAKSWIIDEVCVAEMQQVTTGGARIAVFAGPTSFVIDDTFTVAVANDFAGKFQTDFERFFGAGSTYGLVLPSDAAPTIADALVS